MIEVGHRYGRLTVVADLGRKDSNRKWLCLCDCSNVRAVLHGALQTGNTKSCGCFQREETARRHRTHGMRYSATFKSWSNAKNRCHNPNSDRYAYYGARGIQMCHEWRDSFAKFFADMGERPKGTTLDRVDNSRGYEPENCRWATKVQQANNTRFNRLIEAFGRIQTLSQWAAETGLKVGTIWARLNVRKMSPEAALTTPKTKGGQGRAPWNKGIKGTGRKPKKLENV